MPTTSPAIQPRAIELQYSRDIREIHEAMKRAIRQNLSLVDALPNIRNDADPGQWSFVNAIAAAITLARDGVLGKLQTKFEQISHFSWVQWARTVKKKTGHALQEIRPWSEPGIDVQGQLWVRDNISLITSMSGQMEADFNRVVYDAVKRGLSKNQLKAAILEKVDSFGGINGLSAEQRADLIATDQILKANSNLLNQRQRNAGVRYYTWHGVRDNRERLSHVALEQCVFRVDGQPMTDEDLRIVGKEGQQFRHPSESDPTASMPGQPVRCRCTATTNFKGSVFDIGEDE